MKVDNGIIYSGAYGGIFSFEHPKCRAVLEPEYQDDDSVMMKIRLKFLKSEKTIYTFRYETGLARSHAHTNKHLYPINELPHSDELIKFINLYEKAADHSERIPKTRGATKSYNQYFEELKDFFEIYGYPFETPSFGKYENIPPATSKLLDRIYILTTLQSACREIKKNYNKIFHLTFSLIFSEPCFFGFDDDGSEIHKTPFHPCAYHYIYDELDAKPKLRIYDAQSLLKDYPDAEDVEIYVEPDETEEDFDFEDETPVSEEKIREEFPDFDSYSPLVKRCIIDIFLGTIKDTRGVIPEDNRFYAINDYFLGDKVHNFMRLSDYLDSRMLEDEKKGSRYVTGRMIKTLYVSRNNADRNEKLIYDFLYHFINDIAPIDYICQQSIQTIYFENAPDLNKHPNFTQRYKDVLLEIAANEIKYELEYVLQNIHPVYDADNLMPGWSIPDFHTAMYYSIFLGTRQHEIYRVCGNPYCNNLFKVVITNSKKKYCSETCRAVVAQRTKRMRERLDEEERREKTEKKGQTD